MVERQPGSHEGGWVGRFLLWVVGANPDLITDVSERRWYHAMGSSVLVVTMFAFIGAATTLHFRYSAPADWPTWVVGGLIWSVAVFVVDRGITSYVERYPTAWRKITTILPRIALAVLTAVAISEAMVLNLLDNEITQQLAIDDAQNTVTRQNEAATTQQDETQRIDGEIARLTTERDTAKAKVEAAQLKVTCETAEGHPPGCENVASTGVAGEGPLVRDVLKPQLRTAERISADAQKAFDDYIVTARPAQRPVSELTGCGYVAGVPITQVDEERCAVATKVAAAAAVPSESVTDVVLNRIIALFHLGKDGSVERLTSDLVHAVLFGLFLMLDLIPLIMKFTRSSTGHDDMVRAMAQNIPPRFDDRGLTRSWWRDRQIGEDAMVQVRAACSEYYAKLFPRQVRQRLDEWVAPPPAAAPLTVPIAIAQAAASGPGPARRRTTPVAAPGPSTQPGPSPSSGVRQAKDNLENDEPNDDKDASLISGAVLDGRYQLFRRLGRHGPHYAIYEVRDLRISGARDMVVAKIAKNDSADGFAVKALQKEVAAGSGKPHPNNMPALSPVLHDRRLRVAFRIMPLYPLGDLSRWISNNPGRTLGDLLDIGSGVLNGIQHNHEQMITHWDLKPENVLLANDGGRLVPVIGDWGNGKTQFQIEGPMTDDLRGTFDYCAPEQLTAEARADRRCYASDLYSWAAMMFALATGVSPHRVAAELKDIEITNAVRYLKFLASGPTMPRLAGQTPRALATMLHRCLSIEPELRSREGSATLSDDDLRRWQVADSAVRELKDIRRGLTADQLRQPVQTMIMIDPYGQADPGSSGPSGTDR